MLFKPLSGANIVSECLRDIDKRMNEWYERATKTYYWLVDVVTSYKFVNFFDVLLLGIINTCRTFKSHGCFPYPALCDDLLLEIDEFCSYAPTMYALKEDPKVREVLREIYESAFKLAHDISTTRSEEGLERTRILVPLGYFKVPFSAHLMMIDIYYPKGKLLSLARRLGLEASEISMDANIVSSGLIIRIGKCTINYEKDTGLSIRGNCQNTSEFCDVIKTLLNVVDSSINLFERISKEGVRVITTYLLY